MGVLYKVMYREAPPPGLTPYPFVYQFESRKGSTFSYPHDITASLFYTLEQISLPFHISQLMTFLPFDRLKLKINKVHLCGGTSLCKLL